MQTRSTIYSRCPSCHKDGLVEPVQDTYRCALCNFDYRSLAGDDAAREAWMLENLRLGAFYALWVLHLHRQITALPPEESRARVLALAEANGIRLPKGKPPNGLKILAFVIAGAVAFAVLVGVLAFAGK